MSKKNGILVLPGKAKFNFRNLHDQINKKLRSYFFFLISGRLTPLNSIHVDIYLLRVVALYFVFLHIYCKILLYFTMLGRTKLNIVMTK